MSLVESTVRAVAPTAAAALTLTGAGSEMRPACPTSCCSSAVALRTPANMADRLVTVVFNCVMFSTPLMTTPDTTSRIRVVIMTSISVKPASAAARAEEYLRMTIRRAPS